MSTIATPLSDETYLDTKAAAEFLGLSVPTLERWRSSGGNGLKFSKCGPGKRAPVRYQKSALIEWLVKNQFSSTSEYGRCK